jgi:hypothetical protein
MAESVMFTDLTAHPRHAKVALSFSGWEGAMADDFRDFFSDPGPIGRLERPSSAGSSSISFGTVEEPGDRDWFEIFLTAGVTYRFELLGQATSPQLTLNDPYLYLISGAANVSPAERRLLAQNDDSGVDRDSYIVFTAKYTFFYFIEASAFGSGVGTYNIRVEALDPFAGAAEIVFSFMNNDLALPVESSPSGVAAITQFAQGQFAYGEQIGVFSPTVYMYETLGLAFAEISPALQGRLSPRNTPDPNFVSFFYDLVFGVQPSAPIVQGFVSQLDFFESIYVASGAFGEDLTHIQTLARGAVIGQMLGISAEAAAMNLAVL